MEEANQPKTNQGNRLKSFDPRLLMLPVALALVWCVWSESFTPRTWLEGAVLGLLALFMTRRFFMHRPYLTHYRMPLRTLVRYIGVLCVEIFRSGVHAIYILLTDRLNVGVVDLPTEIRDPLPGALVATAITLTPGTVTIDFSPGRFKVIWIDCFTEDPDLAAESIKGRFERVLQPLIESSRRHAE